MGVLRRAARAQCVGEGFQILQNLVEKGARIGAWRNRGLLSGERRGLVRRY